MRVAIVGTPSERLRLRSQLAAAAIDVVAEFPTLALARASNVLFDGIVVGADGSAREDAIAESLTPRELEVLELLAEGLPNKAIARRLGISDQTVKFHVSSIAGKLGAANRTDAVRRAVRRGLLTL
jgi:DNA-binding NarL/FixJ family response regulator